MSTELIEVDVLCLGHACYDLVFSVARHPETDEKIFADELLGCGGGPAANAAIAVSKLGKTAAFAGYLGQDLYGEMHHQELLQQQVDTHLLIRGSSPTPLSTVLVKPDGKRALINYKGSTQALLSNQIDFSSIKAKAILFDGHEPNISLDLLALSKQAKVPIILDAGSLHEGTSRLWNQVDYLVASEKFACQFANNVHVALAKLAQQSPNVVITLGDRGLIWQKGQETGKLPAYSIKAIDSTGAGDAFHGAFAAAIADDMDWISSLKYASAAGALCCTKIGARQGLPNQKEHAQLFRQDLL
ncbi:MAG: carbohydrate kinase [Methylococcales bacterium]|nr:carbohydrate kinase [Methylococcales bacterium]